LRDADRFATAKDRGWQYHGAPLRCYEMMRRAAPSARCSPKRVFYGYCIRELLPRWYPRTKKEGGRPQCYTTWKSELNSVAASAKDEHDYPGCLGSVRAAVASWKQAQAEVFVPLAPPPGEAQADFGRAEGGRAGVRHQAALFVLTLPHRTAPDWTDSSSERLVAFGVTGIKT
jgi:hypothetical protein